MNKLSKSVFIIAFASICILMNQSCTSRNLHPEKTRALDSIVIALNKADSTLSRSDTVLVRKCVDHIFVTIGQVQRVVTEKKDTISKNATEILRNFNGIRWQLQTFLGREPFLRMEIQKSEERIKNLSHDIRTNRIPTDSVNIFFNLETKTAIELLETARHGFNSLDTELPLYNLIAPKADSLINRLSNNKGI